MIERLIFFAKVGDPCTLPGNNVFQFLAFPHWYEYLNGQKDGAGHCLPAISGINDVWLIVAAVIEILLRIAGLAAVIFVIYGGISYITSEGDPAKTAQAKSTLINAAIGLAIAVMAASIVSFLAGSIS